MGDYAVFECPMSLSGEQRLGPAPASRRGLSAKSFGSRGAKNFGSRGASAERGRARTVSVFLLIMGLSLIALACLLPFARIRAISVAPGSPFSVAEIRAICGLEESPRWFSTNPSELAAALKAHPKVADASAEKRFPDGLVFTVRARVPLAVLYARSAAGRMEAHCVDAEGVVFAPASECPGSDGLPVLSGLEIRQLRYGMRLEGPFAGVLGSLAKLAAADPGLLWAISELRVVSREGAPAEMLVYPAQYRLPVRTGTALEPAMVRSFLLVLDVVESGGLGPMVRELDFRSDTYVLRTKEAVSG